MSKRESEPTNPQPDVPSASALDDPVYGPFVMEVLESVLDTLIANGEVNAREKSRDELRFEAATYILDRPGFFDEWTATPSYESALLAEARRYVGEGRSEFAVMMFATWIEHRLNWLLMQRARRNGLTLRQAAQVVREANMPQKTGTAWLLLFQSPFDAEAEKDVQRVASARNGFVHYKWPESHLDDGPAKITGMDEASSAAERVVLYLDALVASLMDGPVHR